MMRKTFTPAFKKECVELVLNGGYTIKNAAQMMDIGMSTLQRWLTQYRKEQRGETPTAKAITAEQQKIQELEAKIKRLESDNELLKKASAFFAQEMSNDKQ